MTTFHAEEEEKYDEIFTQIAGQIGSVQGLLDKFFGFMHRKTDFYIQYEMSSSNATMGFPEGVAETMVLQSFKKHKMKRYKSEKKNIIQDVPSNDNKNIKIPSAIESDNSSENGISRVANNLSIMPKKDVSIIQTNSKGLQIPIGNGGIATNYCWTQTLNEVTVYIDASDCIRGKDVKCELTAKLLKLSVQGKVLVEGEFEEAVKVDDSMWSLNIGELIGKIRENSEVVITLEKTRKTWWKHVIIGDPEIDTSKVNICVYIFDAVISIITCPCVWIYLYFTIP